MRERAKSGARTKRARRGTGEGETGEGKVHRPHPFSRLPTFLFLFLEKQIRHKEPNKNFQDCFVAIKERSI